MVTIDEFGVVTKKNKKVSIPLSIEEIHRLQNINNTSLHPAKPSKRHREVDYRDDDVEIPLPKSDESDYAESDSNEYEKEGDKRRINDDTFIMDIDLYDKSSKKRTKDKKKKHQRTSRKEVHSRSRDKRMRRVIEDDDDDDNDSVEQYMPYGKKLPRWEVGYSREDNFIQPEGDPNTLPEDVARRVNIVLGRTKAELRQQWDIYSSKLLQDLQEFDSRKNRVRHTLANLNTITNNELQDVNTTVRILMIVLCITTH